MIPFKILPFCQKPMYNSTIVSHTFTLNLTATDIKPGWRWIPCNSLNTSTDSFSMDRVATKMAADNDGTTMEVLFPYTRVRTRRFHRYHSAVFAIDKQ